MSETTQTHTAEDQELSRRQREARKDIRVIGDPVLREHARDVTEFDRGLRKLAKRMIRTMHDAPGVGLAAPQVGVLQRLLVYDVDEDPRVLVNPVLDEFSEETEELDEGCLSVPGVTMPVERPVRVRVRALDEYGEPVEFHAEGFEARVIQHENDHLDGVLIVDRTTRSARAAALRAMREGEAAGVSVGRRPLSRMRYAYAGTAPFAELVLAGLAEAGGLPAALVTNPDRPRGRHGTPQAPHIKTLAAGLGVPVLQPERLSAPEALEELLAFAPQVFVVCAYGQIVAQSVLDAVETVVVHPSLVPHWRGAAPVERALMAGETDLGVCVLKMTAGVDEGPVGDAREVHVPRDADAGRAYELLAPPAVEGVLAVLRRPRVRQRGVEPAGRRGHVRREDRSGGQGDRLEPAGRWRSPTRCGRSRRTSARSPSWPDAARASGAPGPPRVRSRERSGQARPSSTGDGMA